jgi:hypothetical protein
MKKFRSISILGVIAIILFSVSTSDALALTLTPVKIEITGDPGQTLHGEIGLYNEQAEQKVFYTTFENFEPGSDEDGSPKFVGGGTGLSTWIQTESAVTLQPNQKQTVPYTITIPEGTEPGGYFSAIFFGGQNPDTLVNGEVSVGGKLGTLILLSVRGDIEEGAGIMDFKTDQGRVYANLPIAFSYRMSNSGADRIVPTGDITVTNTFGMKTTVLTANEKAGSVLPSSARRFSTSWSEGTTAQGFLGSLKQQWETLHIGWYTAHARIAWGSADDVSPARYDFFIIPWQLLSVVAVLVAIALTGMKRYNKWIISRAKSST